MEWNLDVQQLLTPHGCWMLLKKHPRAELYLFLSQTNSKLMSELGSYFKENGYAERHKLLNEKWMVMVVRRRTVDFKFSKEKPFSPQELK